MYAVKIGRWGVAFTVFPGEKLSGDSKTDEECGQLSTGLTAVQTSHCTSDFPVPHPSALRAATFPWGKALAFRFVFNRLSAGQKIYQDGPRV